MFEFGTGHFWGVVGPMRFVDGSNLFEFGADHFGCNMYKELR